MSFDIGFFLPMYESDESINRIFAISDFKSPSPLISNFRAFMFSVANIEYFGKATGST